MNQPSTAIKLTLDEVRRLTGPNLLSDYSGAILDVFIEGTNPQNVVDCWQKHLNYCQQNIGWHEKSYVRFYAGGASMSISAPMDLLYSACDCIELAWDCCVAELQSTDINSINVDERLDTLRASITEEKDSALIAFIQIAENKKVRCLVDDDEISLGTGISAKTWPINELPYPNIIKWQEYADIPLALITGTNGKSTSVRLAAEIAKAAQLNAGVTSTDFIKVGDDIIDEGDYSGPGGARMLLRDTRTEIAFLEVARGGLLRRGLPVYQANAALVTNVASDHLGQYGINTVDEIAHVKLMVAKAIKQGDTLVLNADDKRLVKFSNKLNTDICWFSKHADNPLILEAKDKGKPCTYAHQGDLVLFNGSTPQSIAKIKQIPMTVQGTALHNLENALGVTALCHAMGINSKAISQGLFNFGSDAQDNPGRTNMYNVQGATVIVDFAHNAHSMQAVIDMVLGLKKQNNYGDIKVLFSHAGDRSELDMTNVADAILTLRPTTYILAELDEYLRGRESGEISDIVEQHLLTKGVESSQILRVDSPLSGATAALNTIKPNDLVLLFALSEREAVQALIESKQPK